MDLNHNKVFMPYKLYKKISLKVTQNWFYDNNETGSGLITLLVLSRSKNGLVTFT